MWLWLLMIAQPTPAVASEPGKFAQTCQIGSPDVSEKSIPISWIKLLDDPKYTRMPFKALLLVSAQAARDIVFGSDDWSVTGGYGVDQLPLPVVLVVVTTPLPSK